MARSKDKRQPVTDQPAIRDGRVVVLERDMIKSQAFRSLRGTALQVLFIFLSKRVVKHVPVGKRKVPRILNNGEIIFTYKEAREKLGISDQTFSRAIGQLIDFGFIDIAIVGTGIAAAPSQYAISGRWRRYGKPDFVPGKRVPRALAFKFPKGNEHYKRKDKKGGVSQL